MGHACHTYHPNTSRFSFSKVSGHRIVLSADEGVFLAELDDVPGVPWAVRLIPARVDPGCAISGCVVTFLDSNPENQRQMDAMMPRCQYVHLHPNDDDFTQVNPPITWFAVFFPNGIFQKVLSWNFNKTILIPSMNGIFTYICLFLRVKSVQCR